MWRFLKQYTVSKDDTERSLSDLSSVREPRSGSLTNKVYTHTSLNGGRNFDGDTGVYSIPNNKINEFYKLVSLHDGLYFIQTVCTENIRLFIDLDSEEELSQQDIKECVLTIRTLLKEWFDLDNTGKALALRNSASPNKKIHIHFPDVVMNLSDVRDFVESLKYTNNSKWSNALDFAYNGCRMIGACKWKRSNNYGYPETGRYTPCDGVNVKNLKLYEHAIWSNCTPLKTVKPKDELIPKEILELRERKKKVFNSVVYTEEQLEKIHEMAKEYDSTIGEIREVGDNGLITWWREEGGWCDQCCRVHDKDNTRYAFSKGRDVFLGCVKASGDNRYIYLGDLGREEIKKDEKSDEEDKIVMDDDPISLFALTKTIVKDVEKERRKIRTTRKKELKEAMLNGV